ncbi:MAG: tRNA (adenosine(37)-N6)-dimethylallyltransferase MiaA [Planctomycetota bacterium]|nr:tRNA (adenosine(37)-N6)-dimethylallyltransferase MiaA [Planctomycetota bacterium]MDA1106062.1 tRNA (adenosine(37)-N6)-dimethylallyltransferase MiaA [Planctomycetota bacterium]
MPLHATKPPLRTLLIVGPTAGGKSSLAMELAAMAPAEIVSADSMQVYKGMDIGTAKATGVEREAVPHHMIDIADPHRDEPTVADWLAGARQSIADIHTRGRLAIVVGGTNLYVRALIDGLAPLPGADEAIRAALEEESLEVLRSRLTAVDPEAASRIHVNDRRRTVRALEVAQLTGRPLSSHQVEWGARISELPPGWSIVGLEWEVEQINRRINARVKAMIAAGFADEVQRLRRVGPLLRQPSEAVGYAEMLACLNGQCSEDDAIERIAIRTRRYAKQQRTWLRHLRLIPGAVWIPMGEGRLVDVRAALSDNFDF